MEWYYSENGAQRGPVSLDTLAAMMADGKLGPHEHVWREGMARWVLAGEVLELRSVAYPLFAGDPRNPYSPPAVPLSYPGSGFFTPPTYLWQSIVVTLMCCMPFGVVAIVYAAKVDGLAARGDMAGAENASRAAKLWCIVSVACGLLPFLLYIVFAAATGVLSAAAR